MARSGSEKKQDWSELLNADGKADGITPQNYYLKFRAFANHHARHPEDVGKTINPIDHPQQWGAWVHYFKTKKLKLARILQVGQAAAITSDAEQRALHGYHVPAKFPSDFDADREWVTDQQSGDVFMNKQAALRKEAAEIARTRPPLRFSPNPIQSKTARQ